MSGIQILLQFLNSPLVQHVNSVLRVSVHRLISSTGHTEEEILDHLLRLKVERLPLLTEIYQLLKVRRGDEALLYFIQLLYHICFLHAETLHILLLWCPSLGLIYHSRTEIFTTFIVFQRRIILFI
jgi:hypothetical protein